MKRAALLLIAIAVSCPAVPARAEEVSSQETPESAREFKKTEFDAVITGIDLTRSSVTVVSEGVEYRLKAPRSNLTMLKRNDNVHVYLRGNGEDKIAWKLVKRPKK